MSIRGILRGFGLKVGPVTRKTFETRIRELVTGHTTLERIAEAMLRVKKMSPAESREPGMRWYVRHSMKLPMFCCRG